jgi:uncharacterized membrane protein YphA (DoxX/SURF4 family)
MLVLISINLISAGAGLCAIEDLISFRLVRIALKYGKRRAVLAVVVSALLAAVSGFALAAVAIIQNLDGPVAASLGLIALGLTTRALTVQALDGSDRMQLCAAAGVFSWVALSAQESALAPAARLTLLILVGIAYFESGYAKLKSPGWRNGRQLALVLNMKEFGNKPLARLLLPHPWLGTAASWAVILIELLAGPMLAVGGMIAIFAVIALTLMHLSIAVFMGLGRFFFPFVGVLLLLLATQS